MSDLERFNLEAAGRARLGQRSAHLLGIHFEKLENR